jgi:hypothetical protein
MVETIEGVGPLVKGVVSRGRTVKTGNDNIFGAAATNALRSTIPASTFSPLVK